MLSRAVLVAIQLLSAYTLGNSFFVPRGCMSSSSRLGTNDSSNSSWVSFNWKISAYILRSMLGFDRNILVGQDSLTMCSMSEAASSTTVFVASTIAAFFFLHVFSARKIQSRIVPFLRKIHASSMTNTLNVAVF